MADVIALASSLAALAIAGLVALWEWKARPRYVWSVAFRLYTLDDVERLEEVDVRAGGTAVAHKVRVFGVNCSLADKPGESTSPAPDMSFGSPAMVRRVFRTHDDPPVVVIVWTGGWPLRERGLRVNLGTGKREAWQWRNRMPWRPKPGRWKRKKQLLGRHDPWIVRHRND